MFPGAGISQFSHTRLCFVRAKMPFPSILHAIACLLFISGVGAQSVKDILDREHCSPNLVVLHTREESGISRGEAAASYAHDDTEELRTMLKMMRVPVCLFMQSQTVEDVLHASSNEPLPPAVHKIVLELNNTDNLNDLLAIAQRQKLIILSSGQGGRSL